ncbi:protein KIAA0100-like [Eriocheir sinensis]|uniref:protein KIAA0100-like n=1 Tax=Eriocheir sinensis TaxID=95602 RepID=UPI0021C86846|nr:protein KIAA0100-like [Eriocheir sinensis]
MYSLQTVFLVIVVFYYVITRGFPRLLSWLIVAKYQTEIKIGWISLLRLSFEDVLIKKSGLSIKVERIGATSSLFNQEERKIFAIKIHDVRIEKEVYERRSRGGGGSSGQGEASPSRSDLEAAFAQAAATATAAQPASMPDVIRVRIPPSMVTLAQFFGVHIMSVSVMFLREKWPECLLHASAEKITLEGATLNQSNIALIGSVTGAQVQVLQHAVESSSSSDSSNGGGDGRQGASHVSGGGGGGSVGGTQNPSLMECAGSLKLSVEVNAETIAAMENIYVQLSQPQVTIRERLLTFLEHKALAATPIVPSPLLPATAASPLHQPSPEALLRKYWLFLPLKFQMKIEDIGVKFMNGLGQMALQGTLAAIDLQTHLNREGALENLPALLPDFSTELQVDLTRVQGTHDSLVTLNRFNLQTQFVGDRVNMKSEFRWLHVSYDHRDLAVWTTYLSHHRPPPYPHLPQPCVVDGPAKECVGTTRSNNNNNNNNHSRSLGHTFLQRYCVGLIVELWDVSCGGCVGGASQGRASLQRARFSMAVSQWAAQVVGELLLESLVATLGSVKHSITPTVSSTAAAAAPKRTHVWGTPAYVGLCLVQWSSSGSPPPQATNRAIGVTLPPLQAEALIEYVQLEWSPELGTLLTALARYSRELKSYMRRPRARRVVKEESAGAQESEVFSAISAKCTNINVFAVSEQKVSIMARVDSLESQKSQGNFKTLITGTKLLRFVPAGVQYFCTKSSEIKGECGQVSEVVVEVINDEVLVSVSDQLHLTWSTDTHMTLLTLAQELMAVVRSVRPVKVKDAEPVLIKERTTTAKPAGGGTQEEEEEDGGGGGGGEEQGGLKLQILARGDLRVGAVLSQRHHMCFILGDLTYLMANGRISCQSEELQVHFDEHKIMSLTGSKLSRALNSREVREEREAVPELTLKQNKSWKFVVDTWKLTFPYEYNFAEAFSDDLLSVLKWVKLVHKHQPRPFTADSPLPPDVVIMVRHWLMEVGDDPFEVKLRYNYELLEDEYQEGCKRTKALDARIEELRKTMFLFPTGKIEELYKNLQEKNSETYIKRSKLMYESAPMRTQLFTWTMEDVVIFALADPTFHGTERVVHHMTNIDPDSPWPEEGQQFSTLWCRLVSASCGEWNFRLRDYPQSLLLMKDVEIWGRLIGAEQKASKRAIRTVKVEVGAPWTGVSVQRTMSALKFYHDFSCEVKSFTAAYGPCWEPAVAQFNIALSLINQPSRDPSAPLPWWDKMRLLFHGRLTLMVERMTLLLHASLDPYNTTEEMELTWTSLTMDWTNAKVIFKGELNVYVRTASKYDDAKLLHLPNLKLTIKMNWQCQGNPNDHHSIMMCAPDKLPEYSSNQEHDSYRVFRSQNLNMNIVLETKTIKNNNTVVTPVIEAMFYGSTLRWFENLKFILSGVARPTRRGPLFKNTKARRPQLSRHYGTVHLSISFHRFDVRYWMSVGVKKGFHLSGEQLYLSSEHILTLVPVNDGLKHRPRSCWEVLYLCSELRLAQVWLQSAMEEDNTYTTEDQEEPILAPVEKFYFLNVNKVEYKRETPTPTPTDTMIDPSQHEPTHRLIVHDLKGVWTTNNRDIVLALYDSWTKSQQLRRNLTPDIIKNYNPDAPTTAAATTQKPRSRSLVDNAAQGLASPTSLQVPPVQSTPSPMTRLQSGHAQAMLQQLIAEADNNQVAYSEDCSKEYERDQVLHGLKACTKDDVIHKRWLIELVDSQVLLKGCESQGYVILSAAKSQIRQQIHRPVWQDHSLVTKTTWIGSLQCMQYYATVSAGDKETQMDNIMWLTMENIMEKDAQVINEIADIVGSGQSVGGVVSQTVGTMDEGDDELQLQRIVSRCSCSFFYVSYGETDLDMSMMEDIQQPLPEDDLWNRNVEAVDTFTLAHEDLCASTNSLQYNMVVDILNNLLLYVDPKKKEAMEAVARMRFQLQLYSCEDQRKPIIRLQNQVRYHLSQLRSLEKEVYLVQRQLDKDPNNMQKRKEKKELEEQVSACKEQVNSLSEELALRIHCYNESQLSANHKLTAIGGDKQVKVIRMNEVYFRKAQWRLTEADGQLGIADLVLSNFIYTKKTNANDSGEHLLELGYITMRNLLPNQPYQEVLMPSELQMNMPVDRQRTLRIYCREKPPCGGISIIEHFEINVVPLNIALTYQFFKTMMKFCFPDNATEEELSGREVGVGTNQSKRGTKKQASIRKPHVESSFYVSLQDKDDVEIMKQRAEQNKLFVYIKIPELPVRVSYKGKKEKNLEDVTMVRLVIPTLEYHNVTWTWLDFLMAIKQDSKSALLSQAIKHKLKLAHFRADDAAAPNEEEKARLLLGSKLMPPKSKATKKSLFKFNR